MDFLKKYTDLVDSELSNLEYGQTPSNLYDPVKYFMNLGGKRIRPILTLMSSEYFSGDYSKAMNAALCVELFHNFSLVHDDIMDEAPTRRNQETVHIKWNQNIGILSGDLLLIKAYEQLQCYEPKVQSDLLSILNKTAKEVCEGQQIDMDFEKTESVSIEEYINMIRLKTSVLLGCALSFGAIVSNCSKNDIDGIYAFGVNLGIAFQIQDDILDLYGQSEKVGKMKGGDILKKKKSILSLVALENGFNWGEIDGISEENIKIEYVLKRFDQLNVFETAQNLLNQYGKRAKNQLNDLVSDNHTDFHDLIVYLLDRDK